VVVAVEVAALRRVLSASVALGAVEQEALDRRADDFAALGAEDGGEFVGQHGLAGGRRSVDGDP
jgi:hypothetical protein